MSRKFTSTIAGASIFIAAFGFISKGVGFFREILFANLFGLSTNFDLYLVGAVIPLTINIIVLCLGQNYLIPAFNKLKENNSNLSGQFIQTNFFAFIGGGILLSGLLYLSSDLIINTYFQSTDPYLEITALNVFHLFLITIPINSGISVLIAYQQSNFEFKYPVVSQLILNVIIIITVLSFQRLNIYSIPTGYIIGSIIQLTFLLIKSRELFLKRINLIFRLNHYKKFASFTLIIIILIESIGQLYLISDRYFFSKVTSGGISALNYGQVVFMLPLSIISIALSTAIFPKLSQLFNKKLITELEKVFNDGLIINIVIFTPVMFLFIFYGEAIIKLIFERGKFSGGDSLMTSGTLFFYSVSIIFYASYSILNKMLYSAGLIDKLLYITIGGIAIKLLFNFLLVESMEQNGLALSTSISFIYFFSASIWLIYKRFSFKNKTIFFTELFFQVSNGLISILLVQQITFSLPNNIFISFLEIILFLSIFFLNLFLLKISSIQILVRPLKNIL